jgi:hypothetical protein
MNTELKTEFTQYAMQQLHPKLLEWYSRAELQKNLEPELFRDTIGYFEAKFTREFHRFCNVPDVAPNRYAHRVLEVAGRRLIAGIRFFGGNVTRPFVEVARISQPLENDAQRDAITDLLRQEFAEFAPSRWRILQASHLPYQFAGCEGDLRILTGLVSEIRQLPMPENAARMRLELAKNTDFYLRYVALYQQLYLERPWLPDVARTESLEDMHEYLEKEEIYEIFVDGEWAGIIIVTTSSSEWGMVGWLMVEIVLTAQFRGQDLAVTAQRLLVQELQGTGALCLFGTIGAVNAPMQKTAARVGRLDIGGYFWVKL